VGIGKAILIVVAKFGQVMFQSGILMNWKLSCVFSVRNLKQYLQ